jgi:hypothetical protein
MPNMEEVSLKNLIELSITIHLDRGFLNLKTMEFTTFHTLKQVPTLFIISKSSSLKKCQMLKSNYSTAATSSKRKRLFKKHQQRFKLWETRQLTTKLMKKPYLSTTTKQPSEIALADSKSPTPPPSEHKNQKFFKRSRFHKKS